MRRLPFAALLTAASFISFPALAQAQQNPMPDMPGMEKPKPNQMDMSMDMSKPPTTLIETELAHTTSGTSIEPASTPVAMIMSQYRGWTLMLHGTAFLADIQQSGPRGADKLFSTNWIMPMATHQLGRERKIRPTHPAHHALPRTRHHHRPLLPRALPAGRNRLRQTHHRRPAPSRLHHGTSRSL